MQVLIKNKRHWASKILLKNTDWISTILLTWSIPKFYRWNNTPALIPGGAHDNESITTLTVNPKTGRIYTLADMLIRRRL